MHATTLLFAALAVCNGLVAGQTGCGYGDDVDYSCRSSQSTCDATDSPCACSSYEAVSSCYAQTCTQSGPDYYSADVIYFCTDAAATRTAPATVSAFATGSLASVLTDLSGLLGSCDVSAFGCLENVVEPACLATTTATSCICPFASSVFGCLSSYCQSAIPTAEASAFNSVCGAAASSGLSQRAKIGVGVGAGVGGALAIVGIAVLLAKAGVFAGAGGAAGAAGAVGGSAASAGPTGAAQGGNMTMAGKAGFYGYTPGGEATNLTSPPPVYAPSGAETGTAFSGYGPTGAEGSAFSGHPGMGPTGTEGSNFSAPGNTGPAGSNFSAPGNTMGSNFTAPGNSGMSHGFNGASFAAQPPAGPPPNAAYLAVPAAVMPLATGVTMLSRRKQVGSGGSASVSLESPATPPPSQMQQSGYQQGRYEPPNMQQNRYQQSRYETPNMQHELGGEGLYYGSELGAHEAAFAFSRAPHDGRYQS